MRLCLILFLLTFATSASAFLLTGVITSGNSGGSVTPGGNFIIASNGITAVFASNGSSHICVSGTSSC